MDAVRRNISHLTLTIVAIFALQWVAISFCAMPASAAVAGTAMHTMHDGDHAMAMPCLSDEMSPSESSATCNHCDVFDTVSVLTGQGNVADQAPLVAVLMPDRPANQTLSVRFVPDYASLHGPPRSSSLIYSTSLRILR
ncbi:MAG: hypothetical protein R8K46_05835 [Mariprofundaceae bacterium]